MTKWFVVGIIIFLAGLMIYRNWGFFRESLCGKPTPMEVHLPDTTGNPIVIKGSGVLNVYGNLTGSVSGAPAMIVEQGSRINTKGILSAGNTTEVIATEAIPEGGKMQLRYDTSTGKVRARRIKPTDIPSFPHTNAITITGAVTGGGKAACSCDYDDNGNRLPNKKCPAHGALVKP